MDLPLTAKIKILTFTPLTGHPMRARTNASFPQDHTQEIHMKRLALVAAAVLVAACSTKEAPKTDTAAPAMAPAPAAADTGMKMDSAAMKMDTAAAKMDTAAKKMDSAATKKP
jgi:hypothetical protein